MRKLLLAGASLLALSSSAQADGLISASGCPISGCVFTGPITVPTGSTLSGTIAGTPAFSGNIDFQAGAQFEGASAADNLSTISMTGTNAGTGTGSGHALNLHESFTGANLNNLTNIVSWPILGATAANVANLESYVANINLQGTYTGTMPNVIFFEGISFNNPGSLPVTNVTIFQSDTGPYCGPITSGACQYRGVECQGDSSQDNGGTVNSMCLDIKMGTGAKQSGTTNIYGIRGTGNGGTGSTNLFISYTGTANSVLFGGLELGNTATAVLGQLVLDGSASGNVALKPLTAASGTLTLPNGNDVLVGRATTDTLTNKSIAIGEITGITLTGLGSTGTLLTGSLGFSASPTLGTLGVGLGTLGLASAGTGGVTLTPASGGSSVAITFPTDQADTVALVADAQTLQNKTLTGSPSIGIAGNLTAASWGVAGLGFTTAAATYTDSTASDSPTTLAAYGLGAATEALASGSGTITNLVEFYIPVPVCGTNFTCTNTFSIFAAGGIKAVGTLNGTGGSTVNGGVVNLNANSNNAVNIGTGTTTSNVSIGGASNKVLMPSLAQSSSAQTGTVCWSATQLTVDTTVACLTSRDDQKVREGDIDPQSAVTEISAMHPFWGTWNKQQERYTFDPYTQPFLSANELSGIDSRLVAYDANGNLRGVRYEENLALAFAAIKYLQSEVTALQSRNQLASLNP